MAGRRKKTGEDEQRQPELIPGTKIRAHRAKEAEPAPEPEPEEQKSPARRRAELDRAASLVPLPGGRGGRSLERRIREVGTGKWGPAPGVKPKWTRREVRSPDDEPTVKTALDLEPDVWQYLQDFLSEANRLNRAESGTASMMSMNKVVGAFIRSLMDLDAGVDVLRGVDTSKDLTEKLADIVAIGLTGIDAMAYNQKLNRERIIILMRTLFGHRYLSTFLRHAGDSRMAGLAFSVAILALGDIEAISAGAKDIDEVRQRVEKIWQDGVKANATKIDEWEREARAAQQQAKQIESGEDVADLRDLLDEA